MENRDNFLLQNLIYHRKQNFFLYIYFKDNRFIELFNISIFL